MDAHLVWPGLFALGAAHGINPAMGWLFAVAAALQERDGRAVWRALGPLALGHALAIAVVLLLAAAVGRVVPPRALDWTVAAALVAWGMLQLRGHRHPRGGGMRMSGRDLTVWSFLVASAHGAGLMALPLVLGATAPASVAVTHAHGAAHGAVLALGASGAHAAGLAATAVHTLGYLALTGLVAAVVYQRVGLRILRCAWLNLNVLWALALIATGMLTLLT